MVMLFVFQGQLDGSEAYQQSLLVPVPVKDLAPAEFKLKVVQLESVDTGVATRVKVDALCAVMARV